MAEFDQVGRYLVRRVPPGFFAWLSRRFVAAWSFRGWLDTSNLAFPGEPERICDTVGEFVNVADPSHRCLLDVEVQSHPHVDMLERLGEYAFRLRRERRYGRGRRGKYHVISVLLNLTGAVQPDVLDMTEATLDDAGSRLQVVQRTLREEDAADTLRRIATGELERCVLPWVVLMRGAGESAIIEEWRGLALQEADESLRGDYGSLALVFAELARRQTIWRRALEGWNMRRSRQVAEWRNEGLQEGRQEGLLQGQRQILLQVLNRRFPGPLPSEIVGAIEALTDSDELRRWVDAAVTASSLAAFRAAVGC